MRIVLGLLALSLSGCATTFGIISDSDKKRFESTIRESVDEQSKGFVGRSYYSFFNTPTSFKNVTRHKVHGLEVLDVGCRTFQSSVAGYSITCTTQVKVSFLRPKKNEEISDVFKIISTFKNDKELVQGLDGVLKKDLFDEYFKENDPLKGKRKTYSKYIKTIESRSVAVGMPEGFIEQSWGKPNKVNLYSAGRRKQYIYGSYYIYTENGKVTNWQKL